MKALKKILYFLLATVIIGAAASCDDEEGITYSPLRVTHENGSGLNEETLGSEGGTITMAIRSTVPWEVTCDASWLNVSQTSGNGDATVTLTAPVNDIDTRTATVTVSSPQEGVSFVRFTVTQAYKIIIYDEYYVTPDGSGNGNSWDNPLSAARLGALLADAGTELENVPIYLSEGTFKLGGTIYVTGKNIRLYGGYSAQSTGTSLDQRHGETILSGDLNGDGSANAGDCAIFDFTECNVQMSNLIFENGYAGERGSAITVHGGTDNTSVELIDCIVRNCNSGSGGNAGAALSMAGGILKLNNVQVTGNHSTNRGAGVTMNEAESDGNNDSYLFMTNCTFSGNTVDNDWGTALNARRGFFCVNNSTFYAAPGSGNNCAVINADAACILVNSTFIGNEGVNFVVRNNNGDPNALGFANCLFVKNGTNGASADSGDKGDNLSRGWNVFQGTNFSFLDTDTDGSAFEFGSINPDNRWYEWTAPALNAYATQQDVLEAMRGINATIANQFIEWVGEDNFAVDPAWREPQSQPHAAGRLRCRTIKGSLHHLTPTVGHIKHLPLAMTDTSGR